jgi:hypothetical protein
MAVRRLLPFLFLPLLACSGPQQVLVQRQRGIEGAWRTDRLIVRTRGESLMVYSKEHTFEVQHFSVFHGVLEEGTLLLRGDAFEIRLTEDRFEVGHKQGAPQRWALASLPKDKIAVYDGFDLTMRDATTKDSAGER